MRKAFGIGLACAMGVIGSGCGEKAAEIEAGDGLTESGGAISLESGYRLPQGCAEGERPSWNASAAAWVCAQSTSGGEGAVRAGNGLELEAGVMSLAPAYQLPQSCPGDSVPRWDGSAWSCAEMPAAGLTDVAAGQGLTGATVGGVATLALDTGFTDSRYARRLARTVIVSPTGDPAADGATLRAAFDNLPRVSSEEPVLVQIEPGRYDLGPTPLALPDNVLLEGAGPEATVIFGTGSSVLETTGSVTLRQLGVHTEATGVAATAVNSGAGKLRIENSMLDAVGDRVVHVLSANGTTLEILSSTLRGTSSAPDQSENVALNLNASPTTVTASTLVVAGGGRPSAVIAMSSQFNAVASQILSSSTYGQPMGIRLYLGGGIQLQASTLRASGGADPTAIYTDTFPGPVLAEFSRVVGTYAVMDNAGTVVRFGGSFVMGAVSASHAACAATWNGDFGMRTANCQ